MTNPVWIPFRMGEVRETGRLGDGETGRWGDGEMGGWGDGGMGGWGEFRLYPLPITP
ncbi:MAG: hypothetical protein U7123_00305 [Potamolinea sp.]